MKQEYDVVVVGGGTAGVIAAVQAGRAGARLVGHGAGMAGDVGHRLDFGPKGSAKRPARLGDHLALRSRAGAVGGQDGLRDLSGSLPQPFGGLPHCGRVGARRPHGPAPRPEMAHARFFPAGRRFGGIWAGVGPQVQHGFHGAHGRGLRPAHRTLPEKL